MGRIPPVREPGNTDSQRSGDFLILRKERSVVALTGQTSLGSAAIKHPLRTSGQQARFSKKSLRAYCVRVPDLDPVRGIFLNGSAARLEL